MPEEYDAKQCDRLRSIIEGAELHHPPRPTRYDPGQQLEFDVTGVHPAVAGRATLVVERFVGGGFAGQVYRARLTALDGGPIPGLEPGAVYAVKILVPPSRFSQFFRDAIYRVGYQCPFAAQVNAGAARTGVLWQKLIRRGAQIRFGSERCVADTYATFLDPELGAFGEINEWVDGRNWRFEIDDEVTGRRKRSAAESASSREYLAKKEFMAALVRLFHDMGAPELARQYEWWTAKSQPNVLKRLDADATPEEGLTALDFRAGLALLPFLPMSPADFKLIVKGMARGDLVQFDRGDLGRLRAFCAEHEAAFADLMPALEELEQADPAYRRAQPDLLHHGLRLMYDGGLRRAVKAGFIEAWRVKGRADEAHAARLGASSLRFWLFFVLGVVPFLGTGLRKLWGASSFARHVAALFTSLGYLARALRASRAQCLLAWYRTGKVGEGGVEFFLRHPVLHFVTRIVPGLLPLPPKWHRFLTDPKFAARSIAGAVVYPVRFYRDAAFRVEWLTGEIEAGAREGMLTPDERQHILERVPDPFIQKYLKCVAVHICTLPITQVASVAVAIYAYFRFGESWEESGAYATAVLAAFQVLPVSPGSFVRGTYVLYLMIKERNWRNYWIAALVSYWHYIGYLGFPLQMVTEFPALARFMAGRWATRMVGFIPVFGERGALLEHWVFDAFFNIPLTIRRRFGRRKGAPGA